ncbi:hypothetical protein [Rhodococcus phenolicus]|uniref:hypothetical protein n=1 Tax=Rhodococcus phenolicus TaxID=263849 RepID=UPI000B2FD33D|nr:hypothetical protein [Rhodococcus phenolicus]
MPIESPRSIVPPTVRIAGSLVVLEGVVAIAFAVYSVVRALSGTHDQSVTNGYGLALWLGILFGGVLAAGIALLRGKRWGRAVAVVAQLLLLPVAWSLLTDSHQVVLGIVLAVIVLPALVLLFAPQTTTWLAEDYAPDAEPEEGPDGR